MSAAAAVPLALVHHANDYLLTDGYDDREGITELVSGYADVLRLHRDLAVPVNLHLSGTLVEATAWHCRWFLELVRELRTEELLQLIGGTYAESVMTLFRPDINFRQLDELLWLYEAHLGCSPGDIDVCWVPERVWDTAALAEVLTSSRLANGGYRYVLLDERILHPTKGRYRGSARARFDRAQRSANGAAPHMAASVYRVAAGHGLTAVPISADLRTRVPPGSVADLRRLVELFDEANANPATPALLTYADELGKSAGIGLWDAANLRRYESFLRWVASRCDIDTVRLGARLSMMEPGDERPIEPGTYVELARSWGAGEDYRGWGDDPQWRPYQAYLTDAEHAIRSAEREGADERLVSLAWKHLLASTHQTARHDWDENGVRPASRARGTASHARACHVICGAARWLAKPSRQPSAQVLDIDGDGHTEVVLRGDSLYAVFTPRWGGRLTYLFADSGRHGALIVGNPSDDWNGQEELDRFMEYPENHPGALVDVGFENCAHRVSELRSGGDLPVVELVNADDDSPLLGARKRVTCVPGEPVLAICYQRPDSALRYAVDVCVSPDYLRLLRAGRTSLWPVRADRWAGFRNADVLAWVALAPDEPTVFTSPDREEVGHGLTVRVRPYTPHFHLLVGCGATGDWNHSALLRSGIAALHHEHVGHGSR